MKYPGNRPPLWRDQDLANLIESVLDNESVDVRQAIGVFAELSLARQELITLDEEDYAKLKREAKGDIRDDVVNWSGWSPPYPATGIVATGQLEDLSTGDPNSLAWTPALFSVPNPILQRGFRGGCGGGRLGF